MSGDERYDRDIRSVLHDLAADPAPDRLVERVASIPSRTPAAPPRRSITRLATALAAAAVIVLVAGVVITTRPGGSSPIGGVQPAGGSPAASAAESSSSGAPVAAASPVVPAGGSVPAGFQAVSVTFASPDLGWVLGTTTCSAPPCTAILRTTDGGRTWAGIPAPRTAVIQAPAQPGSSPGVSGLRFAGSLDGWAYGPDLWATHDGGATWHLVTIPGLPSGAVIVGLEASAGSVHAIAYETSAQVAVRIASSPVGADTWTLSPTQVAIGAGPVPQSQLVLAGSAGWLLQVDRTVVGGARLVNGAWIAWTPPCATVMGPAVLAASSATELVAACDGGIWGTPPSAGQQGEHLYVSHDGGATFAQTGTAVPLTGAAAVASPAAGSVLVAGTTTQAAAIAGSFDGGASWQTVLQSGQPGGQAAVFTYVGFTTSTQGVALTESGAGTGNGQNVGTLYMTRDGGRTWSAVSFAGQ